MISRLIRHCPALGPSALFLLFAAAGGSGCRRAAAPPPVPPVATVSVRQPVTREVVEWDEFPGRLEAVEAVEIRARVTGYLQSVHFRDGSDVKKGDLLFVIDPRPYQAELAREQAHVRQAETRFELTSNDLVRAERLLKSKAISEEEADMRNKARREAEAALQSARAALEIAALNVAYTQIHAPINGRIGRKRITEGNLVNGNQGQSTLLTTIVSLDPIYCYVDADEQSVLKYQQLAREGKRVSARDAQIGCELGLANEEGFPHQGTIDFVDNQVDPATGTLRARGVFPNPERSLVPGFFARLRVHGSGKYPALLIPDEALGSDQGNKFVLVVNAQEVIEYRPVKTGPLSDGLRVVREGIQATDWVVVNGLMSVRPGAKVKAERLPPNPSAAPAGAAAKP
jgi:multidrug efflux system membrane fusion protein